MSVLDWLDPTRGWPEAGGPAPQLNRLMQLDALPFGSPIESAHVFGRPEKFHWNSRVHKDCELLYARNGVRLRFREGKLRDVTFLIGLAASDHPDYAPAQPAAPDGTRLTPQIDRARIEELFGPADPGGSDDTCLQIFHRNGLASDFYLDARGHLTEWTMYPDD